MKSPQIIIHRSEYVGRLRKLWIFIDVEKKAYIKNGGSVTLDIDPGNHEIIVSMDYLTSNKLELTLGYGETVHLECGSTLKGMKLFFSPFIFIAAYLFSSVKVFYIKQI